MKISALLKNLGLGLIISTLVISPVLAATTAQTGTSLTISAGALSVTADEDALLNAVTVSSSAQTTYTGTGTGNDTGDIAITAEDTRGESVASGWSVTATVSQLQSGSNNIEASNFTTNFSAVTTNSGSSTGVTAGTGATLTGTTVSNSFAVLTASPSNGQGNYGIDMGLDLNVPAFTPAGTYTGTVDLSIS